MKSHDASSCIDIDHGSVRFDRHKRIRAEAEDTYLKTISKRQKIFDDAMKQPKYNMGDLVGLKIDKVDRTNTTPKILPCKVVSIQSSSDENVTYKLCTIQGILSNRYTAPDLLDLNKCGFEDLRSIDSTLLPTITFIQACKEYV
ncbi:unnamed protein product, partial [Didymodactylos carnosus]